MFNMYLVCGIIVGWLCINSGYLVSSSQLVKLSIYLQFKTIELNTLYTQLLPILLFIKNVYLTPKEELFTSFNQVTTTSKLQRRLV